MRRVWCLALVLLHVAVLALQAPHLVHHAFESDVTAPDECAFAAAADHGQAPAASAVAVDPPADVVWSGVATPAPRLARFDDSSSSPRAPPRLSA